MAVSNWQQNIQPSILRQLLTAYDRYIQTASRRGCYKYDDWIPLNIEEFYHTEFQLVAKRTQPLQQTSTATTNNSNWSTFSKNDLLNKKQKPWWSKWLPWGKKF